METIECLAALNGFHGGRQDLAAKIKHTTPISSMKQYQTPSLRLQCWLPADALTTTRTGLAHAHEDEQPNAGGKGNRSEAVRDKLKNYTSYTIARKKNRLVQQNIISKPNTVGCVNGKHNIFIHQVKAKLTKNSLQCWIVAYVLRAHSIVLAQMQEDGNENKYFL